jgi:hypothetical protein
LLAANRHSSARAMSSMAWRRCSHCWQCRIERNV